MQEEAPKKIKPTLFDMLPQTTSAGHDHNQRTFLFVGDKQSGKTSLVLKALDIQLAATEQVKST